MGYYVCLVMWMPGSRETQVICEKSFSVENECKKSETLTITYELACDYEVSVTWETETGGA